MWAHRVERTEGAKGSTGTENCDVELAEPSAVSYLQFQHTLLPPGPNPAPPEDFCHILGDLCNILHPPALLDDADPPFVLPVSNPACVCAVLRF